MLSSTRLVLALSLSALAACSSESGGAAGSGSAASSAAPANTTKPTAKATASGAAAASASSAPRSDCPKGSAGPGTLDQPCAGKGNTRLMEAVWNGKIGDKGPFFNVTNKSPAVIVYGRIAVYFYDKAGKQLEVKGEGKSAPYMLCSGNIFSGVMKVDEKALLTFSCVTKADVPADTAAIEAEMMTVGFADANEKVDFYWANRDLTPDVRPKGGVK